MRTVAYGISVCVHTAMVLEKYRVVKAPNVGPDMIPW